MSRSLKVLRISTVLAFGLFAAAALNAQSPVKGDKIAFAKKIIGELYPELKGRGLQVLIQDKTSVDYVDNPPSDFALWLYEPVNAIPEAIDDKCPPFLLQPVNTKAPLTNKCPSFLLTVGFTFADDERVSRVEAGGEVVNIKKLTDARHEIDSHPDWSNMQIQELLGKKGAHVGPSAKDDLVKSLPTPAFKSLLGDFQIASVDFLTRDGKQVDAHLSSAILVWNVSLIAHVKGRTDLRYRASFEPFEGKLLSLVRSLSD